MKASGRDIVSWVFPIGIAVFAAVLFLRPPTKAPVPGLFETGSSNLDEAIGKAEGSGRVVFAFATADWCGPCQGYKKGALSDPRVTEWVRANAEAVYIDVDVLREDAQRLNVSGIPATYLIDDGKVVSEFSGAVSAEELLGWLEANAPVSDD